MSSPICGASVASAMQPGRQASPRLSVTSYSRQISRISSKRSKKGFSFPVISIHANIIEPPRETMFVRRLLRLNFAALSRLRPQCIVMKSTPSSACMRTMSIHSSVVICASGLW